MRTSTILVIEDDPAIRRGMVDAASYAGYHVVEAPDGPAGIAIALECAPDLVLLDVMLPGCDGFAVLREIRGALPALPVIMVTARGAEEDRIRGLKDGADDYVTKPFSALELLARIEAVLRRSAERPDGDVTRLTMSGRTVDLDRQEVIIEGAHDRRALTEREVGILRYLATRPDRAVDRDELLQRVWGLNPRGLETRTVDMQIARLREKLALESDDNSNAVIATVRGKGYMLADGVHTEART